MTPDRARRPRADAPTSSSPPIAGVAPPRARTKTRHAPHHHPHALGSDSDSEPFLARVFTAPSPLARGRDADRWRTRNPSERRALLAPSALARVLDETMDGFLKDSSTRRRLVDARRRCRRLATRARPDARAMCALLSNAIETCDRRRRGALVIVDALTRRARRRARRLRDFAETNAWTARELTRAGEGAEALGAVKRRLATRERALARALVRAVGGKSEEEEEEEDGSDSESESAPRMRIFAPSPTYAPPSVSSAEEDDEDEEEEEELMMTTDAPMVASPTPTIATQPLSDEDSDRGGDGGQTFTSPRTKNVVEILMEMDHRHASIGTTTQEDGDGDVEGVD